MLEKRGSIEFFNLEKVELLAIGVRLHACHLPIYGLKEAQKEKEKTDELHYIYVNSQWLALL